MKRLIVHFLISLLIVAVLVAVFDFIVLQNLLQDENGIAPYRITVPFPFAEKVISNEKYTPDHINLLGKPHDIEIHTIDIDTVSDFGLAIYIWDLWSGRKLAANLETGTIGIAEEAAGYSARWLIFPCIVLCLSLLETFLYWKFLSKKRTTEAAS